MSRSGVAVSSKLNLQYVGSFSEGLVYELPDSWLKTNLANLPILADGSSFCKSYLSQIAFEDVGPEHMLS